MRNRWSIHCLAVATAFVLLTVTLGPVVAAQVRRGDPHVLKPNAPPTPRLADGTPNFGSTTPNKGTWVLHVHNDLGEILVDPKGNVPYQPWAKALRDYRHSLLDKDDPLAFCLPAGGPRALQTPFSIEFIQQPERQRIIIIYEDTKWHVVYMDGRPHPRDVLDYPSWLGHSTGRWEGDTLVVDTTGFNEGHWLDTNGSPRTHLNRVVERFRRLDYLNMEYEATIDDPGAYTRPWTIKHTVMFDPNIVVRDSAVCQENNRFLEGYVNLKMEGEK